MFKTFFTGHRINVQTHNARVIVKKNTTIKQYYQSAPNIIGFWFFSQHRRTLGITRYSFVLLYIYYKKNNKIYYNNI